MPVKAFYRIALIAVVLCARAQQTLAEEVGILLDIPAGRLAEALTQFGQQSGEQIVFTPSTVEGKRSQGLKGSFTVNEAIERLLAGSGLRFLSIGNNTLAVVARSVQPGPQENATPRTLAASTSQPVAPIEQVVVTGTSIHSLGDRAPVGSSLITISQQEIHASGAQTLGQALANIPSLTGFGAVGQGATNSSYYAPAIHQLGASASNSTLVMIDGHRVPEGGTNHPTVDPNILPLAMIDHIEILADGASATYGSDAVAGVINIITRNQYNGVQLRTQRGFLQGAANFAVNILAGRSWTDGTAVLAYSFSLTGQLRNTSRSYTNPNHLAQGGSDLAGFACSPATLQAAGDAAIYQDAFSGQTVSNPPCSGWAYGALVPQEQRQDVMLKLSQQLRPELSLTADFVFGDRSDRAIISRGTATTRVFRTGQQANPFYIQPAGYAGSATSETARWDANVLLGPGAFNINGADTFYAHTELQYRLSPTSSITLTALVGRDESFNRNLGSINGSVVNLALNGTPNSAGISTGIVQSLTFANALDVWNPAMSNRTDGAVRARLLDNANDNRQADEVEQIRLSTDGALFDLPSGSVSFAAGLEYLGKQISEYTLIANNTGPASNGSLEKSFYFGRSVHSAFAEVSVPLVEPAWKIPLVQRLDLDIAGRYDAYSDFGTTSNPKIGFNWDVADGLRLRGNASTSFVAPSLDVIGNENGVYAQSGYATYPATINVPLSSYPTVAGIPGCADAVGYCTIGSTQQGIQITNGNHAMKAQRGRGWSLSAEIRPEALRGFETKITLWNNEFLGAITTPNAGIVVDNPPLNSLLSLYPSGATAEQITAATAHIPQTGVLPSQTYFIFDFLNGNYLNLNVRGLDASASYRLETESAGIFSLGDATTVFLRFDESFGQSGPVYSVLNTVGGNQTFPSVGIQSRAWLEWSDAGLDAILYANYTSAYQNWSGTTKNPVITNALGDPVSGGDHVGANMTFDVHFSYAVGDNSFGVDELSLDVRNIVDSPPPFYNSVPGYNTYVSSPLGRVVSIGLRAHLN